MTWQNFNWVDFTIIGIIGFSTLVSVVRGFIREVLSLVVWIIALWVAYHNYEAFAAHFLGSINSISLRGPLAFLILFLGIVIIGAVINFLIGGLVYKTGLSGTDRVLGLIFGIARGVLLVAILILGGQITAADKNVWWQKSQLLPQFSGVAQWVYSILPEEITKVMQQAATAAEKPTTEPTPAAEIPGAEQQPSAPEEEQPQEPTTQPAVPSDSTPAPSQPSPQPSSTQ